MTFEDLKGLRKIFAFIQPVGKTIKCKIEEFENISYKTGKFVSLGECYKLTGFTNGLEISFYVYGDSECNTYRLKTSKNKKAQ